MILSTRRFVLPLARDSIELQISLHPSSHRCDTVLRQPLSRSARRMRQTFAVIRDKRESAPGSPVTDCTGFDPADIRGGLFVVEDFDGVGCWRCRITLSAVLLLTDSFCCHVKAVESTGTTPRRSKNELTALNSYPSADAEGAVNRTGSDRQTRAGKLSGRRGSAFVF